MCVDYGGYSVEEQLVVIPGGQNLSAGGTPAVQPDTLRQAEGTEDMTTGGGQEVMTFTHDSCEGLHANWALNAGEGGVGGGWRDSGAGGTGHVLDGDWSRGGGRSCQVYGGVQRGPGLWAD